MPFTPKYVVNVQTTTIFQEPGKGQQFEQIVMECEDFPKYGDGMLSVTGRILSQEGTQAKIITFLHSLHNIKFCAVESKGSADIVIPRPVIQSAR
jgi:hypothetical protein